MSDLIVQLVSISVYTLILFQWPYLFISFCLLRTPQWFDLEETSTGKLHLKLEWLSLLSTPEKLEQVTSISLFAQRSKCHDRCRPRIIRGLICKLQIANCFSAALTAFSSFLIRCCEVCAQTGAWPTTAYPQPCLWSIWTPLITCR